MSSTSDDAPCGTCHVLVCGHDQALECDICGLWYHARCSGVSTQCYETITNSEGLTWICTSCRSAIRFATIKVRELDAENATLKQQLTEMHNELKQSQESRAQSDSDQKDTLGEPAARSQSDEQHPPIRGSASCPILTEDSHVTVAAEESRALPATVEPTVEPTPPPTTRPKVNRKSPAHAPDFPEIRFIRNVPKEMPIAEVQSALAERKFVIEGCWIEQTIKQEEFKGARKFVRIILPNKAAADKFAGNMQALSDLKWKFSRVAPQPKLQAPPVRSHNHSPTRLASRNRAPGGGTAPLPSPPHGMPFLCNRPPFPPMPPLPLPPVHPNLILPPHNYVGPPPHLMPPPQMPSFPPANLCILPLPQNLPVFPCLGPRRS